jgi:hypothetical protein
MELTNRCTGETKYHGGVINTLKTNAMKTGTTYNTVKWRRQKLDVSN